MSMTRIMVTGGNGYVGRYLTAQLADAGYAVCVADLLRYDGDWRPDLKARTDLRLERVDIRDAAAVAALMADFRPEIVVHLAAIHYIPECENEPELAVSTNVTGTMNLLAAMPEGGRFVFASSGAVYRPDLDPHTEDSAVGPSDIYGFSKLHGEDYVRAMAAKRSLKGVIVRLFNVIGPGETNPHLFPELVAQLKAGRNVIELGNLTPQRDYISVRDAAAGFAAAARGNVVAPGETCVVNLGTSNAYSVLDIVERLRRASGLDFEIRQAQDRVRKVDRPMLAADNRRIAALFGWQPQQSVDETLAELWAAPDLAKGLLEKYL